MAKRKRLTPPRPEDLAPGPQSAPETKGMFPSYPMGVAPAPRRSPPIADMAGAAAAHAALSEVSAEMQTARDEGRLVQLLALDTVDEGYLVRDRITVAEDEMQTLMASLRARGQQTPIEVVETAPGRFGLISGWRRLTALRRLQQETDSAEFDTIRALVRRPEGAAQAYVSMVEENEIRVGLSYFERARIVARAVEAGVCADVPGALNTLFASASRAKRSKIKSFLPVVETLGAHLRHPTALSERLGLELSQRLQSDPGFAARLKDRLRKAAPETPEAEVVLLTRALADAKGQGGRKADGPARTGAGRAPLGAPPGEELAPGVFLRETAGGLHLSGPGLTPALVARLRKALAG